MARIGDDVSRQRQRLVVPVSFTLIAVLVAALLIAPTASEMFFNGSTTATILIALAIILGLFVPLEGGIRVLRTKRLPLHLLRGLSVVLANMSKSVESGICR